MSDQPTRTPIAGPGTLLSLRLTRCGSPTVIEISGGLDLDTAHLLTELVEHVVERHRPARVVLDLARVTVLRAGGLRALLEARAAVAAGAGRLLLRSPSARARRVLTVTGTRQLFPLDTTAPTGGVGTGA